MSVSSDLLDAMTMTEVRHLEEFEAMTWRRTSASNKGSIVYRLREPQNAHAYSGHTLTKIGDARMGGLQLSYVHDRLGTKISFPEPHPLSVCLMTVLQGNVQFGEPAAETTTTATAGGFLLAHMQPGKQALTADGTERLNLWISAQAVRRCFEEALQEPLRTPLIFSPMRNWPRGVAGTLERLVRYVADELADPYSSFAGGVGVSGFEDLVTRTLLEGVTHNYTDQLARVSSTASPYAVSRALAFMRENVLQNITVADVAQAAGCSSRALSSEFRKRREQTITSTLRGFRLDSARAALVANGCKMKVAEVAIRLGFSNTGRFAKQYHQRFGETPLETRNLRFGKR